MPTLGSRVVRPRHGGRGTPGASVPAGPDHVGGPARGVLERLRVRSSFDGIFLPRTRRIGVAYACLVVPVVTAVSAWTVHDQHSYIFTFVSVASGAFTTPALAVAAFAVRRTSGRDRPWARLWFGGLLLTYLTGLGLLAGLATGSDIGNPLAAPLVVLVSGFFMVTIMGLVRSRSGRRALSVDILEGAIALVVVLAPAALAWGHLVASAEARWFVVPAVVALIACLSGMYWSIVLRARLGPGAGVFENCAITLTLIGAADAAAQVAQGTSGFTLPAPPLIALHAASMAMLLVVPLYQPRRPVVGLDRLPPQAQVRGGGLVALMTLAAVPVLVGTAVWAGHRHAWAHPFALGAVALLVVLGALRHLAIVRETQRLYAQVERASEERRTLLAEVIQRADEDRHRVAAQLHEQAVSAYASFVSLIQACGGTGPTAGAAPLTGASTMVRDDLARHAESLRQLMLAIQPLESDGGSPGSGTRTLSAPIHAYLDSLYGDRRAPRLAVSIEDGVVLDWTTETIALRIVQEALRNVRSHSEADHVTVSIASDGGAIEVRITDDGVGFHTEAALFESGIAAMRSFAAVIGGHVTVDSAPGAGTVVTARLGAGPGAASGPAAAGGSVGSGRPVSGGAAEDRSDRGDAVDAVARETAAARLRLVPGGKISR